MASTVNVERPRNLPLGTRRQRSRVSFKEDSCSGGCSANASRRMRSDCGRRKRSHSCSLWWDHVSGKRRRSNNSIVLPTKFLLGGNITDPLNLEALDNEDLNKKRKESSGGNGRRGVTVKVIIPPNINDPLNLDACSEDGDEQLADAIWRQRRRRKTRKRKRRNSEPETISLASEVEKRLSTSLEENSTLDGGKPSSPAHSEGRAIQRQGSEPALPSSSKTERRPSVRTPASSKKPPLKGDDKIVSPVVPQPGVERKRHLSFPRPIIEKGANALMLPPKKFHPKNNKFQYGNYNQYYGYRNPDQKEDPRLKHLKKEWFEGKEVLDIGCNIGHIALSVAKNFAPTMVVGIDIDKKLIEIAKKNIKHYLHQKEDEESEFPKSMRLLYGPLKPPVGESGCRAFPHNVSFFKANYVLENDALLETVRPEFDVILCLSITKWIHLNWGDGGLKRFFRRMYCNLRPSGLLVFEPQPWPSYSKKRKVTLEIFENYKNITFYPDKFGEYLTKDIGFAFIEKLNISHHHSRGFQRPIYIYRKESCESEVSLKVSGQNLPLLTDIPSNDAVDQPSQCGDISEKDKCEMDTGLVRRTTDDRTPCETEPV